MVFVIFKIRPGDEIENRLSCDIVGIYDKQKIRGLYYREVLSDRWHVRE